MAHAAAAAPDVLREGRSDAHGERSDSGAAQRQFANDDKFYHDITVLLEKLVETQLYWTANPPGSSPALPRAALRGNPKKFECREFSCL
jgi:hypothetical protein